MKLECPSTFKIFKLIYFFKLAQSANRRDESEDEEGGSLVGFCSEWWSRRWQSYAVTPADYSSSSGKDSHERLGERT